MSENKRHIELAVVKAYRDQVTFRIAEQTLREENFTPNGMDFKSRCGYILCSITCPGFADAAKILFVRGHESGKDDNEITVSMRRFAKIMESITEYNETEGKGYETPWPQKGDKYFYIASRFEVASGKYGDTPTFDKNLFDAGNMFRTREDAEAALERVKKALKGE